MALKTQRLLYFMIWGHHTWFNNLHEAHFFMISQSKKDLQLDSFFNVLKWSSNGINFMTWPSKTQHFLYFKVLGRCPKFNNLHGVQTPMNFWSLQCLQLDPFFNVIKWHGYGMKLVPWPFKIQRLLYFIVLGRCMWFNNLYGLM
jgi:hypothetical protein